MDLKEKSVLIVDDTPETIRLLGDTLQPYIKNISYALNGEKALQMLAKQNYDLILLDIVMPNMDGYEVCKRIREQNETQHIPIIFLTANTEQTDIVKGFKLGAQDYVTKPFNPDELISRVNTQIDLYLSKKSLAEMNEILEQKVDLRTQELQEAYVQLNHLDKAKSDFINIISHELRTPLNGIFGFSEILSMQLDEKQLNYVNNIKISAQRLLNLSEAALLITELNSKNYKLHLIEFPFLPIIDSISNKMSDKLEAKAINIQFDKTKLNNINIQCDHDLVSKMFEAILSNAIKFSPESGTIDIDAKQLDNKLIISIRDQGPGFDEESLQRLFALFGQSNAIHHQAGFGLGLATSKIIMESFGGNIYANNHPDGGAIIQLEFNQT
ncbi:MAG: hybrid sensor histidine kinase/response regulator [Gammaproteobacteria bacterium]|nr:hybrid sensor histidine kinase/response regulator [Gammaproteobacteria bacterium]